MTLTLVTGASGMLGSAVVRELRARRQEVVELSYRWPGSPDAELGRLVSGIRPDLIVHCAALTDADYCESHPAVAHEVNSLLPGDLARAAVDTEAQLVYVSTDAVYDGERLGKRDEDEPPGPVSVYARTKLEGEGRVLAAYPEALVVRTTMFGWTLPNAPRPKFAEQILAALIARREIALWRDAIFSPLHVGDLASILLDLGELGLGGGVLNVGAAYPISKADFGRVISLYFGTDAYLIREESVDAADLPAQRPKNVGLSVKRLVSLIGRPPSVEDGVKRLLREVHDGTAKRIRGRESYP